MNIAVTRAAEGFARRAFTVADIFRMIDAGIIGEDENFELIEGEIVPISPKRNEHEFIKSFLNMAVVRALPDDLWLGVESSIYLSDETFVEPDLCVYRRGLRLEDVRGADLLLVIEVAVSSLGYDKRLKAALYARHGVQEYWVIDAERRVTWVHRGPCSDGTWSSVLEKGPEEALTTDALAGLRVVLATSGSG